MEKKSFEELMNELSKIADELENNSLSLEEAIEKYQKGIEYCAECRRILEEAKKVVVTKMSEGEEVPFK